ncbi:Hpt domain-containing protein [Caulobacter sp. S45]|uniref:Hpt domain-containing protein n=1 Tax=Caulobacter sp. S45 TaxID=1641861 RepID=UPI00131CE227|nr:Hpt domain-containing protein [Caulobacter sp. S45]
MSNPSQPGNTGQVFAPPTALRDRLGPRFGKINLDAIAKAEAALKGLSSQFGQWLQDEINKLEAARQAIRTEGLSQATVDKLYGHAHDLKGLGTTYEYPIVTRIAASLCKLLGEGETRARAPMPLVNAHVDAIHAAVRDQVKDSDNPVGAALVGELERHTNDYLTAVRGS